MGKRERPDLLPMPNAWQLADLRALALRVPAPPGYTMPAGASETAFKNFERRTGLQLTAPFRAWLAEINGAMIGPGGLFGVREPSDFLSIEKCLRMYPKWRELGWVPVASDGTGNYWVTAPGPGRSGSRTLERSRGAGPMEAKMSGTVMKQSGKRRSRS